MRFAASIAVTLLGLGCATSRLMTEPEYQDRAKVETSLFSGEQGFASEDAVRKILTGRIELPSKAKLALLKYEAPADDRLAVTHYGYDYWRSESYVKLQQRLLDALQSALLSSGRVSEATALPSMLVPRHPTLSVLRQAGVRLQADLLLVYHVIGDVYYDYRFLQKDRIKAFATCEAVLLDTRTGVIPFTSVATREVLTERKDSDFDQADASTRVQQEAALQSINAIGAELAAFLKAVK